VSAPHDPGAARRDAALAAALLRRAPLWSAAVARIERLERARAADADEAARAVDEYRLLARDLATARRVAPSGRAREYLEAAFARSHALLSRPAVDVLESARVLFRDQIPDAVYALRWHIAWVFALLACAATAGWWLVRTYPDLIGLFLAPGLIASVKRGELWTEGLLNIVPSSILSVQILTNNVVVSLFAYCAGFLFGLGTFYIVGLNGMLLGATFAFTSQHGLAQRLAEFIVSHGCVELSVLVLSGAAGAAVGESLARPGLLSRSAAFQQAALRSGRVLFACVLLLLGAGFIEGYVSPDPEVPLWARLVIGIGYFVVMIAMLGGWLFGRKQRAQMR